MISCVSQPASQSATQACTPYGVLALNFTYVARSLAAKIEKRIEMLLPKFTVLCCHGPMNQSLVTTIHLQFALPTILDARTAFAPRVANAKLFVSSGDWGVEQYETPVSNTNHNTFGTSSQSSRCEQSVLLVRSKLENFMPCEC